MPLRNPLASTRDRAIAETIEVSLSQFEQFASGQSVESIQLETSARYLAAGSNLLTDDQRFRLLESVERNAMLHHIYSRQLELLRPGEPQTPIRRAETTDAIRFSLRQFEQVSRHQAVDPVQIDIMARYLVVHSHLLTGGERSELEEMLGSNPALQRIYTRAQSRRTSPETMRSPVTYEEEDNFVIYEDSDDNSSEASTVVDPEEIIPRMDVLAKEALDRFLLPGELYHPNRRQAAKSLANCIDALSIEDTARLLYELRRDPELKKIYLEESRAVQSRATTLREADARLSEHQARLAQFLTNNRNPAGIGRAPPAIQATGSQPADQEHAHFATYHNQPTSFVIQDMRTVASAASDRSHRVIQDEDLFGVIAGSGPPAGNREEVLHFSSESSPSPPASTRLDDRQRDHSRGM